MAHDSREKIDQILRTLAREFPQKNKQPEIDLELAAAFLEGRLDARGQEEFEKLLVCSRQLRRQVFEEARIRRQAEMRPVPMPPLLHEKITRRHTGSLGTAVCRLVFRAAAGVLDIIKGGNLVETVRMAEAIAVRGPDTTEQHRMPVCTVDLPPYDIQIGANQNPEDEFEVWLGFDPVRLKAKLRLPDLV